MNSSLRNFRVRKFLEKNYLQRNKYSDANITEHKHGHHDEMKTRTEYRKRKHRINSMKTNRLKKLN